MQLISDFITLPELCRRWQCEFELIQPNTQYTLNSRGSPDIPPLLQAYKILSIRECHKGTVKACTAEPIYLAMNSFETPKVSWDDTTPRLSKSEIVFDMREVRALEAENPVLLCASVPFNPAQDLSEEMTGDEQELAQKELKAAQARVTELEAQLEKVSHQLKEAINAPQEVVTVDAALWEDSCKAMGKILVEIIENGETVQKDSKDLSVQTLKTRLKAASERKRIHSKVDAIAWEVLPEKYRNGPGRSSKE